MQVEGWLLLEDTVPAPVDGPQPETLSHSKSIKKSQPASPEGEQCDLTPLLSFAKH